MKTTTSPFIFCYGILLSLSFNHVQAFGLLQLSQATPIPPPQLLRGPDAIVTQASRPHHYFSHRSTLMEHVVLWTLAPESPQGIIATPDQVKTALRNPQTVLLDARTDEEIITGGFLSIPGHRWIHASCTKEDCPLLAQTAESQLPDKNGKRFFHIT